MINIQKAISNKYPTVKKIPKPFYQSFFTLLKKIIHENEINLFLEENAHLEAFTFIETVLDFLNFTYKATANQIENIPKRGRIIIIANHPLGALDALTLIDLIKKVRTDIKIVANDMLSSITQLQSILIQTDNINGKFSKKSYQQISTALENEMAVIIFPSGTVARISPKGIKDSKWHKGFLIYALNTYSPILPVYIKAKNSPIFYTISSINKTFSSSLLSHEIFQKKDKDLEFKIGEVIPHTSFANAHNNIIFYVNLFKKHLYKIAKNKKSVFQTQKCIAHPEERQTLKKELKAAKLIGKTQDNKKIYLAKYDDSPALMREIGRLREFTFRKVEEGTGQKRDNDKFDSYYKHIILWDENTLELVGSYRIGDGINILKKYGIKGFYSASLFSFSKNTEDFLPHSIELGRSFVQPQYWGSKSLDYLWQGIGAYLRYNPHIYYMFGAVSLSNSLPKTAKNLIVYYFNLYYGKPGIVTAKNPFIINKEEIEGIENLFDGNNKKKDFLKLKEQLRYMGTAVPTLYKQYANLCDEGGISFMAYNIDHAFNSCVDSFILIDKNKIKSEKKKRYLNGI